MGLLQNLFKKNSEDRTEFKRKVREAQDNNRIQNLIAERCKSSDERELDSHLKQKREEMIKEKLRKIHKKKNEQLWKSDNSILKSQMNILKNRSWR